MLSCVRECPPLFGPGRLLKDFITCSQEKLLLEQQLDKALSTLSESQLTSILAACRHYVWSTCCACPAMTPPRLVPPCRPLSQHSCKIGASPQRALTWCPCVHTHNSASGGDRPRAAGAAGAAAVAHQPALCESFARLSVPHVECGCCFRCRLSLVQPVLCGMFHVRCILCVPVHCGGHSVENVSQSIDTVVCLCCCCHQAREREFGQAKSEQERENKAVAARLAAMQAEHQQVRLLSDPLL